VPARDELEHEIKRLLIDALMLEDVTPEDIDTDAPLFNEGLGLDSIDSLDLGMALEERYGVKASDDSDENRRRFGSVRRLAEFVAQSRTK
jgi:acyl carrier protein